MMMSDHENNRVLIVDDQKEIHDDFAEMLKPEPLELSGGELAASFLVEESQRSPMPRFELLHARTGEDALAIVRSGKERGTSRSRWPTSTSACLRGWTASRPSGGFGRSTATSRS